MKMMAENNDQVCVKVSLVRCSMFDMQVAPLVKYVYINEQQQQQHPHSVNEQTYITNGCDKYLCVYTQLHWRKHIKTRQALENSTKDDLFFIFLCRRT